MIPPLKCHDVTLKIVRIITYLALSLTDHIRVSVSLIGHSAYKFFTSYNDDNATASVVLY